MVRLSVDIKAVNDLGIYVEKKLFILRLLEVEFIANVADFVSSDTSMV